MGSNNEGTVGDLYCNFSFREVIRLVWKQKVEYKNTASKILLAPAVLFTRLKCCFSVYKKLNGAKVTLRIGDPHELR